MKWKNTKSSTLGVAPMMNMQLRTITSYNILPEPSRSDWKKTFWVLFLISKKKYFLISKKNKCV